jgi:hypothetical protein
VTRPPPEKVALFLRHHREELARIWRVARASARPDVFPGLLDGLVPAFFEACGALLGRGGAPAEAWDALVGVVRWPPAVAAAEVKTEWSLLSDVVAAACESIHAGPAVARWVRAAAGACRDAMDATAQGRAAPPAGIVFTIVYSPLVPRPAPARHAPDA